MKEIKRFDVVLTNNSVDELVESKSGYWCRYEDAEQLQTKIKDLKSRIDFCMTMDKQNQQIIEQAEERIKELESDKHINEIKAKELKDFNFLFIEPELYKKGLTREEYFIYSDLHDILLDLIKKLRNNNE